MDDFGNKFLSKVGKQVLIKYVLQAIHTCVIGCFKIPYYLLHEVESMVAEFWWGQWEE